MTRILILAALALAGCDRAEKLDEDTGKAGTTAGQQKDPTTAKGPVTTAMTPKGGQLVEVTNLPKDQAGLVSALSDKDRADSAATKLAGMGTTALPGLRDTARTHEDMVVRGWAIQAITRMDDPMAEDTLVALQADTTLPDLVRTWAFAGRIQRTQSLDEVLALSREASAFPAAKRPIKLKVEQYGSELGDVGAALNATISDPSLAEVLSPLIIGKGSAPLIEVMLHDDNDPVRRQAAGYLASLGQTDKALASNIAKAYRYTPGAEQVLWKGGALYIPMITYDRKSARSLVGHLVAWHLYCDVNGLSQEKNQINNNLRSIGLWQTAGINDFPPQDTIQLLEWWGKADGKQSLEKILSEQGVQDEKNYAAVLGRAK